MDDALTPKECWSFISSAQALDKWQLASHTPYPTMDTHVDQLLDLVPQRPPVASSTSAGKESQKLERSWVGGFIHHRLYPLLARLYGLRVEDLWLKELVVIRYQVSSSNADDGHHGDGGKNHHHAEHESTTFTSTPAATAAPSQPAGVGSHRDASVISFNILLSAPTDFQGGGTFFPAAAREDDDSGRSGYLANNSIGLLVELKQGGMVIHAGKAEHEGRAISSGRRYVLAGFVQSCTSCQNGGN